MQEVYFPPILDRPVATEWRWLAMVVVCAVVPIVYARAINSRFSLSTASSYGASLISIVLFIVVLVGTFIPNMVVFSAILVMIGAGILVAIDHKLPWQMSLVTLGLTVPIFCAVLLIWINGSSHWDQINAYPLLPYNIATFKTPAQLWLPNGPHGPLLGNWFIIEQAIAPVLDGIEIIFTGQFTGYLNRLFSVGLFTLALSAVWAPQNFSMIARFAISGLLIAMFWEQMLIFRPHMTLGFLIIIFLSIFFAKIRKSENWLKFLCLTALLVLMVFAKRDGVIIAVILSGLLFVEIKSTWLRTTIFVAGALVAFIFSNFAQMAGQSIFTHFLNVFSDFQYRLDLFWPFYLLVLVNCVSLISSKQYWMLLVNIALAVFILISINLMTQSGQFNFGSINRKIWYIYLPFVLVSQLTNAKRFHVTTLTLVGIITCNGMFFASWHAIERVKSRTDWSSSVRAEIRALRDLVPNFQSISLGLMPPIEHTRFVNGPLDMVMLGNPPILQAFFGGNLTFVGTANALAKSDAVLIDRSYNLEELKPLLNFGYHFHSHLGGFKVASRDVNFVPNVISIPELVDFNFEPLDTFDSSQVVLGSKDQEWSLQRWDVARLVGYGNFNGPSKNDITVIETNICEQTTVALRFDDRGNPSGLEQIKVTIDGATIDIQKYQVGTLSMFLWEESLIQYLNSRPFGPVSQIIQRITFVDGRPGESFSLMNPALGKIAWSKANLVSNRIDQCGKSTKG